MTHRIRCYTLFDITQTGVLNRRAPVSTENLELWEKQRKTQCNFDTLIQIISLRCQPEDISTTTTQKLPQSRFGKKIPESVTVYSFQFTVPYVELFSLNGDELAALYNDSHSVPMIRLGTEHESIQHFLDISKEYRNIIFEVINDA
jgi:hypothetical protein